MNRKLPLDIAIIVSSLTGAILSFVYLKTPTEKYISLVILTVYALFFLVLTILDATEDKRFPRYDTKKRGILQTHGIYMAKPLLFSAGMKVLFR